MKFKVPAVPPARVVSAPGPAMSERVKERVEERAAILEFEAKQPRSIAEETALTMEFGAWVAESEDVLKPGGDLERWTPASRKTWAGQRLEELRSFGLRIPSALHLRLMSIVRVA